MLICSFRSVHCAHTPPPHPMQVPRSKDLPIRKPLQWTKLEHSLALRFLLKE